MVGQRCLIPIKDYQFDLHSEKVNSIARLVKLNIPTVPFPHILLPASFDFYRKNKSLAVQVEKELRNFFHQLRERGYNISVRPSIFINLPGAEFIVANNVNLPRFSEIVRAITTGYDQVLAKFDQPKKVEFAHLIQGFYTANKAGVVFSEDGSGYVHIEGAFGEHSWLITRGEVEPDIYRINKKTGNLEEKRIAEKGLSLEPAASGLRRVKLKGEERTRPVFSDEDVRKIYRYALKMESEYGPQEIECAVLRTGEVIFQSSRNSQIKKKKTGPTLASHLPIFSQNARGEIVFLKELEAKLNLRKKVVITENLDIDFITKLVYRLKPKGVVLTKGNLTAHAVTILREAKIPSVLAPGLKVGQQKFCQIKANGEVNCYS